MLRKLITLLLEIILTRWVFLGGGRGGSMEAKGGWERD